MSYNQSDDADDKPPAPPVRHTSASHGKGDFSTQSANAKPLPNPPENEKKKKKLFKVFGEDKGKKVEHTF